MECFGQRNQSYHCKVVLLDNLELIQEIQKSTLAQELLGNIFKHLNLIETAYFGLRFMKNGQPHWLDKGKRVMAQLKGVDTITLYFGVKYYVADPCKLVEEITRYQFFLQIKQDVLHGRLFSIPQDVAIDIFACVVQAELGDYDRRLHSPGYVSEFHFLPDQSTLLEARVAEAHQTALRGQTPATAELNFLDKVKWLEMYGVDLHAVLGENSTAYYLGLSPSGIMVLRNKLKVASYLWPRIEKITRKGRYFMLRVRNKKNEDEMYGFETPTKLACDNLWKCATEQQAFFRLLQLPPASRANDNKISLGSSRFRDSMRSEVLVNRRPEQPFVRVPSKRFQRRPGTDTPMGAMDSTNQLQNSVPPSRCDSTNMNSGDMRQFNSPGTSVQHNGFENSSKSTTLDVDMLSGDFDSASISRVDQRRRSRSAESTCNSAYGSHSHVRRRHHERGRASDNDSVISTKSSRSQGKRRRRKSGSRRESESDTESTSQHHRRRHRHHGGYEFIDSDVQWKQVQMKTNQPQENSTSAQSAPQAPSTQQTTDPSQQKLNIPVDDFNHNRSGFEPKEDLSYHQIKKQVSSSRRGGHEKSLPEEVKRHLQYDLIDTEGMSQEELRQIPYRRVETETSRARSFLLEPKSYTERNHTGEIRRENHPTQTGYRNSPPPSYSATIAVPVSGLSNSSPTHRNLPHGTAPTQPSFANQNILLHSRPRHVPGENSPAPPPPGSTTPGRTPLPLAPGSTPSKQWSFGTPAPHQMYHSGVGIGDKLRQETYLRNQWLRSLTQPDDSCNNGATTLATQARLGLGPVPGASSSEMSTEL